MTIEINNGTFKAISDVTDPVCVVRKDDTNDVTETFLFGIDEYGALEADKFLANGKANDGRLMFLRELDTTDPDAVEKLKMVYGKYLVRALDFEQEALNIIAERKAENERIENAITNLFSSVN